jgi:hypothetical protein
VGEVVEVSDWAEAGGDAFSDQVGEQSGPRQE